MRAWRVYHIHPERKKFASVVWRPVCSCNVTCCARLRYADHGTPPPPHEPAYSCDGALTCGAAVWQFSHGQAKYTLSAAFLMSLQPILMTQSKNPTGGFDYSVPLSTMFSELFKLSLSTVLLIHSRAMQPSSRALLDESAGKEFLAFMLPALIYFVNNNCLFYILQAACAHDEPAHAWRRGPAAPCLPRRLRAPPTRHGLTPPRLARRRRSTRRRSSCCPR